MKLCKAVTVTACSLSATNAGRSIRTGQCHARISERLRMRGKPAVLDHAATTRGCVRRWPHDRRAAHPHGEVLRALQDAVQLRQWCMRMSWGEVVNPECAEGKHRNCDGSGWDLVADVPCDCPCRCHDALQIADRFDREIGGVYGAVAGMLRFEHADVVQRAVKS